MIEEATQTHEQTDALVGGWMRGWVGGYEGGLIDVDVNVYMYVGGGEGWIADWSGSVDGDWVGG